MTQPTFVRAKAYNRGGFVDNISNANASDPETFDVGSGAGDLCVVARVVSTGGSIADDISSFVFGGVTLTALTQEALPTVIAKQRFFYGLALGLTGGQAWTATLAGGTGQVQVTLYAARGVTALNWGTLFHVSGETLNEAVATNANSVAVGFASVSNSGSGVNAPTAPTVEREDRVTGSVFLTPYVAERPGAGSSVNLQVSSTGNSSSPGFIGRAVSLEGTAPEGPVITGPSGAAGASSSTANLAENTTSGPVFSVSGSMSSPYPRITGTDAALFTLIDQGGGSYRVDKLVAGNYEAPDDAGANRVYDLDFEASAAVEQALALTLTDVNEAPTHVGPAIGAQVFTVGVPITPINIASRFTDPEGLAITGSVVEALPAGLSVVAGQLQGTPSADQASASYTPRGADPAGNGTNGTAFTITINAEVVTYSALTDIIGVSGIALPEGTTVYWTWFPGGRPGAMTGPVQGSGPVNAQGRATISHTVAGAGLVTIGLRPGPAVSNDRVFNQFLTLA